MKSKTEQVIEYVKNQDYSKALSIAKTFRLLPEQDKECISKAHAAINNPSFYVQIGKDPDTLYCKGVLTLQKLYGGK